MNTESQEQIFDMVRQQLQRTNPPSTEALYGRAARIDPAIRELTLRQFNARYPLRVRREMAREQKGSEEPAASPEDFGRAAVREILLKFARKVSSTPQGPEFIALIGEDLKDYVDRLVTAVSAEQLQS